MLKLFNNTLGISWGEKADILVYLSQALWRALCKCVAKALTIDISTEPKVELLGIYRKAALTLYKVHSCHISDPYHDLGNRAKTIMPILQMKKAGVELVQTISLWSHS